MPTKLPGLRPFRYLSSLLLLAFAFTGVAQAGIVPGFSKAFSPSTIGPGSVSTLTFTITNNDPVGSMADIAFSDTLPAGVTIASPASAGTTCSNATLSAPNGGTTISLSGGELLPSASCSVTVSVTSSTLGTHNNVSSALSTDLGPAPAATADLTVVTDRPGFTKSFAPASVGLGGRSTLSFLIDNSANASFIFNPNFSDTLPAGMVIASPTNLATTCPAGTLTGIPGSSLVSYSGSGLLNAEESCTVSVDVIGSQAGQLANLSNELFTSVGGPTRSSGKATASLAVQSGVVAFSKSFTDDPAVAGGTATLQFTLLNLDRNFDATGITFTDDLNAVIPGLVATGLPAANVCGAGSSLSGTSLLTLTGGNLAASGDTCTFSVTLQIPPGTTAGGYPNTTSQLSGLLGGSPFTSPPATETLFVSNGPSLTKTFMPDTTGAGGVVTVEFTVTNNSATSSATSIAFDDNLDLFLPGTTAASLPAAGFCGAGATLTSPLISSQRHLVLADADLPAGGSCTFSADLQIPLSATNGSYVNTAGPISATVDAITQVGSTATDTLFVVAAPSLQKTFTNDPVLPGNTVTLEFTLEYPESAPADATAIAFTDDLTATLAGLTAIGLPLNNICGSGSSISGTTNLSFSGGTLSPAGSCTFSVTLQVPPGAVPGNYPNTTSSVMADINGTPAVRAGASDTLQVAGLDLDKAFTDDPALPGGTVTLEFTIRNGSPTDDATAINFTDNLNSTLTGLAAVGLPLNDICGLGSSISGTTTLSFTGGNLLAGTQCTFSVTLQVPGGAADGSYFNTTSNLNATVNAMGVVLPAASDSLRVASDLLLLTKSFTDDPVAPGGTVTLEFTLDNLDAAQMVTSISFTDDLDAALSGLVALGLPLNDVCGLGSQISGSGLLTLTGGNLPAGGSCTFSVTLQVPVGVPVGTTPVNVTSSVSGILGGLPVNGPPASDDLQIQFLNFTKAFNAPVGAGGMPVLTFTLQNLSASSPISGLSFLDNLNAALVGLVAVGLPQSDVCGVGSQLTGTSNLSLTSGSLMPGGSCSIQVTLQVPAMTAPGIYTNTTSELFENGTPVAPPATADLLVEPPPTFAKAFTPTSVVAGGVSTLTFTIDNTATLAVATALDFTDNLPAGMVVATPPASSTTCTGGTLTAVAGSGVVSFSGGSVAASSSCTVQVDVQGNTAGMLVNTSGDLTSSNGNSGPASATLTVIGTVTFTKAFLSSPTLPGGLVQLEYTISNPSADATLIDMTFTDDLDAVISGLAATGLPTADICGAGSSISGTGLVTFAGGNLAPSTSCTFAIAVQVPAGSPLGTFTSTTSLLTFSATGRVFGTGLEAGPASADFDVDYLAFSKAFPVGQFDGGSTVALTFTLSNPDPANSATGITFTDDLDAVLPGLVAIGLPTSDVCGLGSAINGTSVITLTGGLLGPGESCSFDVQVLIPGDAVSGSYINVTSTVDAVVNGLTVVGGAATVATAPLDVASSSVVVPTLGTLGQWLLIAFFAGLAIFRLRMR